MRAIPCAAILWALQVLAAPHARAIDAGVAPEATDPDVPTVSGRADKQKARVGDVITLTVVSVGPTRVPVNLPTQVDLGSFTELSRNFSERDLGDGRIRREFNIKMAAYEPGDVDIPAIALTYLEKGGQVRSVSTEVVPIKIVSILANEPDPALKQNAPPVSVMEDVRWPLYAAAGLGAVAIGFVAGALVLRRLRARAAARPAPPARPAHEIALERLSRLGANGMGDGGDRRRFYFEVSEVVRQYLGARFGFDALEMTTDELVAELRQRAGQDLVIGEVEGWMASCDLVKFANTTPTETAARGVLEVAIRFVNATRPRIETPAASPEDAVATPEAAVATPEAAVATTEPAPDASSPSANQGAPPPGERHEG